MTTLSTTSARNVKRIALGAVAVLAIAGAASTFAATKMTLDPSVAAGNPDVAIASPVGVAHYEPFLATPRWTGHWGQSH